MSQSDIPQTPREVAEELADMNTGTRGVYHGTPLSYLRRWATHRGVDVDETRAALDDVLRERGL